MIKSTKQKFIDLLESTLVKGVLSSFFSGSSWFQKLIVKLVLQYGFDKAILPAINFLYRKKLYYAAVENGVQVMKRVNSATTQIDYDASVDDIFR
jgi:hypothetical protein